MVLLFPQLVECARFIPERKNVFSIGPSISYMQVRDDLIVPLRFSGPHLSLLLSYAWQGFDNQQAVEAKIGTAPLFDRYGFLSIALSFKANYCYQQRIMHDTLGNDIFLGGLFNWSLNDEFSPDWDEEHLYWFTAIDLGPAGTYIHRFQNNQRLDVSIVLPLIAMVSRPPLYHYNKIDELTHIGYLFSRPHEKLHFAFIDTYQAVQISVAWHKTLRKNDFVLGYQANLARTTEPKPVTIFTNSINLTWGFGR